MCDYSLDFVDSRTAKVGDRLVTTKFNNSLSRGFGAVGEPNVAVCLVPGTEVAFDEEVEYHHTILPIQKLDQKVALFRQINKDQPNVHHDALEFPNGKILRLYRLREGQHATVLQLPAPLRTMTELAEHQWSVLGV